jgi:hypothetical protein
MDDILLFSCAKYKIKMDLYNLLFILPCLHSHWSFASNGTYSKNSNCFALFVIKKDTKIQLKKCPSLKVVPLTMFLSKWFLIGQDMELMKARFNNLMVHLLGL